MAALTGGKDGVGSGKHPRAVRLERVEGAGSGDIALVLRLDMQTEVEFKLEGRFQVSPQIAGAIKAVAGVEMVETL